MKVSLTVLIMAATVVPLCGQSNADSAKSESSVKPKSNGETIKQITKRKAAQSAVFMDWCESTQRPLVKRWKVEDFAEDAADLTGRSVELGRQIFKTAGCFQCHLTRKHGATYGPYVADLAKRFTGSKLLEHILEPSREIHKDFRTHVFVMKDGRVVAGFVVKDEGDNIHVVSNPLVPEEVASVSKVGMEERHNSVRSMMPDHMLHTFKRNEILDLLAFIQSAADRRKQ
ncbi:MAG: c-type cytochrome [Planctomycetota bacterium]|nr:c-type cytochrome [Planctomycetota bacterium]